jgi:hypothetical protein
MAPRALHQPLAIYHEHPHWFAPLFAQLEHRGLPYERLDAAAHTFDPSELSTPYSLVFNRASPSAYLRGHAQSIFYTLHWLRHLVRLGIPVVNGAAVYSLELSKASQLDLLDDPDSPIRARSSSTTRRRLRRRPPRSAFRCSSKRTSGAVAPGSCDTTRPPRSPRRS